MNRLGNGQVFNVLAAALVGLTALACLCSSLIFFVPALAGPFAGPPRYPPPLPTDAPTVTPLFPPTWTPTVTPTPPHTPTPFATTTAVPDTPTITVVPITQTKKTTGPTPTSTRPRFAFAFKGEYTAQPSPINPCGSSYIFGTVADLAGKPFVAGTLIVHVEGDGDIDTGFQLHPGEQFRGKRVEARSPFGALLNDPSAWSVVINQSGTSAGTWIVWLVQNGQASNKVQVQLGSDCASSSAIVRFKQDH